MKHTLALVLIVAGLIGCVSSPNKPKILSPAVLEKMANERIERSKKDVELRKEEIAALRTRLTNLPSSQKKEMLADLRLQRESADYANKFANKELEETKKQEAEMEQRLNIARVLLQNKKKEELLIELNKRCEEYGFTGASNISACIQREAQHDKELAMQKYELQKTRVALQQAQSQAQSRAYAQSLPPVEEEEEDLPFLIKFLGDVVMGVAEAYPAAVLEAQQKQNAYNRGVKKGRAQAKPNCGGPNCY
ncbi:hypothetical protein N8472_05050 [Gammaproteobacteria bacterium]|nr:hypothetical protein [Gammaproteobacteria bacterium]